MLEESQESAQPRSEVRRRRWAVPIGAAVLVAGVVVGIVVAQPRESGLPAAGGGGLPNREWKPRFLVTAGKSGDVSRTVESPWFQIHDISDGGRQRLVVSVQPPSSSAGEVRSIVAGPDRTFVIATWRTDLCETVLYRFALTDDGHAKDITPVIGGSTPALVAGLAVSPDGRRIAYATAPCGADPERSPSAQTPITLAVLDTTSGQHRAWTSNRSTILGEIVWASDSRTVGYTTGVVISTTSPAGSPPPSSSRQASRNDTVGSLTVRALDSEAPGSDLLAGRVLFDPAVEDGTVATAVMNPDGRTGYGMMRKGEPPSTVIFTFSEGQPMRVTSTIPADQKGSVSVSSVDMGDGPRYACLDGIDAFERVRDGKLRTRSRGTGGCSAAYEAPR